MCWNSRSSLRLNAPLPSWSLLPLWQQRCRFPSELPSILRKFGISSGLQLTSTCICEGVAALPAFLDTLFGSAFERWHSHLFLSAWLFHQAQENPFPPAFVRVCSRAERCSQACCGFCRNWPGFWNFKNLPLAIKRWCWTPSLFFLFLFGLSLLLLLWHLRMRHFLKAEI